MTSKVEENLDCWLAAFFDGEGCIPKYQFSRGISITQALNENRPIMELFNLLKLRYGGNFYYEKSKDIRHLDRITWRVTKRERVVEIINKILPFSVLRKNDLINTLEYYKSRPYKKVNKNANIQ